MKQTLKRRALLTYIILVVITTGLLGYLLMRVEEQRFTEDLIANLTTQATLISEQASLILSGALSQGTFALDQHVLRLAGEAGVRLTIIRADGQVIGDSESSPDQMDNHAARPEFAAALLGETGQNIRYSTTQREELLYVARPVFAASAGKNVIGAVRVSKDLTAVQNILARIRRIYLAGILLVSLLAGLIGWLFSSRLFHPLDELNSAVLRVSREDGLAAKIAEPQEAELSDLANAVNKMSDKIKRRIEDLHSQRQQLEVILANLADGIIVFSGAGKVLLINESACNLLEANPIKSQGLSAIELTLDHRFSAIVNQALAGNSVSEEIVMRRSGAAAAITLHISAAPVKDGTDVLGGAIVVMQDVTLLRRLEKVRTDFVANVSHELRTPLASIRAAAETLQNGAFEDPRAADRFSGIIISESERLTNLVHDLLVLTTAESPEVSLKKEPIAVDALIHQVVEQLSVSAACPEGRIPKIEILISEKLPLVDAEQEKIQEVLVNLIENAIKYTPSEGRVLITAKSQDEDGYLRISITDNGPGIPEEHVSRIFERFYRVDKDRSRDVGGTGLGLAIVKHLVEAHGGHVGVESLLGRGSTFWFTLPTN